MAILQVRELDDNLYEQLRRGAENDHRSISQEVIAILEAHFSRPDRIARGSTARLLELAGSWEDERTSEEIIADVRDSRKNSSRFGGDRVIFD